MNEELTKELQEVNKEIELTQQKIIEATVGFQTQLKTYMEKDRELRSAIETAMQESGTKSFENDYVKLTYVAPSTRRTLDSTALKEAHPELIEQFTKVSDVKASVRIKVKD